MAKNPLDLAARWHQTVHLNTCEKYKDLKKDILENPRGCVALEFDYTQNLPLPKLNNTSQFYKRLLWQYVFNVHRHGEEHPRSTLYMYLEGEGAKNSSAVVSMVYTEITATLRAPQFGTTAKVILFSDACGGQNKNVNVSKFLSYVAQTLSIVIEQVSPVPVRGHSYCHCDINFSHYSGPVKHRARITHWKTYMEIMVACKTSEGTVPFHVTKDTTVLKDVQVLTQQMFIKNTPNRRSDNIKIQQYVRLR